ncbi:EF-hand domain-containing family member C2 [Suricata suricatta]|nr:EF-hand domain-containing family member C2 [Suricata suricatta]
MLRAMALPLLPGYSFNRNAGKEKFHKSQHLVFCNGFRTVTTEDKPGIGGEPLFGQKTKPKYSAFPKGIGTPQPSWVAFDKQVLSFDAYSEDEVPLTNQEKYIIRRYKILFYLEDDTVEVSEPKMTNSGLPQGTSIRRHRISLPPPHEDQFYTVYDFNINKDVVFYGRTFKIYDCDTFTKNFLTKLGVKLNPPGQCPEDPYEKMRRERIDRREPLRPHQPVDTLKQFLQYNGKVLRFFCLWDDSTSQFGERRELILHYFLCDDTIEVKEVVPYNSGRDTVSLLLRRSKLPKYGPPGVHQPGQITNRVALNIYSGPEEKRTNDIVLDRCQLGKVDQEFYKDSDLFIGATINVWGRKVLLCDCDEFTKTYYKTKYGIENFTPIAQKAPPPPRKAPPPPKIERKIPPYNGFGSEEDSLRTCIGLVPTPPKRGFKKFMERDRCNTLRFFAKLITNKCVDQDRRFIISYFLDDDTLSVFEPIQRNSGFIGGMFLKRSRVKKYGQEVFKSEPSEYIEAEELYIGAKVNLNGHLFHVLNADDYTLRYMEENLDKYPMSNIELVLPKLKEQLTSTDIKQIFRKADPNFTKTLDCHTFRDIVMTLTAGRLTDHEVLTLVHHYGVPKDTISDTNILIAQAHKELKKNSFDNFERLLAICIYEDREKKKVLPTKDIRRLCKSFRLPVTDDLLRRILSRFEDSKKQINYELFFNALNWKVNLISPSEGMSFTKKRCEDEWLGTPSPIPEKRVDYFRLLKEMFGKDEE